MAKQQEQQPETFNGYCVKCKSKRDYQGDVEKSKSGAFMAKGKCPVCGTTICRILGKSDPRTRAVENLLP